MFRFPSQQFRDRRLLLRPSPPALTRDRGFAHISHFVGSRTALLKVSAALPGTAYLTGASMEHPAREFVSPTCQPIRSPISRKWHLRGAATGKNDCECSNWKLSQWKGSPQPVIDDSVDRAGCC